MSINQDRIRYRYGICLNEKCEKCKSKEVQEIPARRELVCPECGKPLRECPPPKRKNNKWLFLTGGILGLLLFGGVIWWLTGNGDESMPLKVDVEQLAEKDSLDKDIKAKTTLKNNSIDKAQQECDSLQAVADSLQRVANQRQQAAPAPVAPVPVSPATTAPTPKPASPSAATSGSKNLGYAVFKGTLRNGQPDDVNGRLVFNTSHVIDSRDPKGRMAEPGDYVIGEFSEGHLVQGIWYGPDNQVKGSIIIGK